MRGWDGEGGGERGEGGMMLVGWLGFRDGVVLLVSFRFILGMYVCVCVCMDGAFVVCAA